MTNPEIVLVSYGDEATLLNKEMIELPNWEDMTSDRVELRAESKTSLMPGEEKFVQVSTSISGQKDIFIEHSHRLGYFIPCCIVKNGTFLPIINFTKEKIVLDNRRLLARGFVCAQEQHEEKKILQIKHLKPFEIDQIRTEMNEVDKTKLLNMINKFRDCFSDKVSEIGRYNESEMNIKMKDDSPVTYRPYRLSYSEREKVTDMVNELIRHVHV